MTGAYPVKLKNIDFGEPDANAEYFISLRSKKDPLYIRAWNAPEMANYGAFVKGEKFILIGRKGTGKTAILRYMENEAKTGGCKTEFIVFKNEVMREAELLGVDSSMLSSTSIEEDRVKQSKFYYHSIKRLMISLILSKARSALDSSDVASSAQLGFIAKLFGKSAESVLEMAFDSIGEIMSAINLDVSTTTGGRMRYDPAVALKRANEDLLARAIRLIKDQNIRIRIFFDEMHFAFRDKESLRKDSSLVRDTVLAAQALNERFTREEVDVVVYLALRQEFLDQPEIAQADIVHVIESYGEYISWDNYIANDSHPIFDFIALRFGVAMGRKFTGRQLLTSYFINIDPVTFLLNTWYKPRDIVRFFKMAQAVDGDSSVITANKYPVILKRYATSAWLEVKSSLAAFVPANAIPLIEQGIRDLMAAVYTKNRAITHEDLRLSMKSAFDFSATAGVKYDIDEFCRVLYIMGIIYYKYRGANGKIIYQQYDRGNASPVQSGEVQIHQAVVKALS